MSIAFLQSMVACPIEALCDRLIWASSLNAICCLAWIRPDAGVQEALAQKSSRIKVQFDSHPPHAGGQCSIGVSEGRLRSCCFSRSSAPAALLEPSGLASLASASFTPPQHLNVSVLDPFCSGAGMAVLSSGTCQDAPQGPGGQGELVHSSKDTPGSADTFELGSPRCSPNLDLLNMVVSYKRMAVFLEPLVDVVDVIGFLLRWKMPLCSLSVWIFLNIFFCTVSEVGWFTLSMMGVLLPAALGYLQDRCGSKRPEDELQRRRIYAVQRRDLQTVQLTKQEAMMEVKELLKHLDDSLSSACQSAESVYKLLYWDDHCTSSRFYAGLLTLLCLLYVAPVGWVLAALTSASFLWNRDFCRVLLDLRRLFLRGQNPSSEGVCEERESGSLMERTPTPTSLEDLSPGSVEEAEEAEPDDEFKDPIEEDDDGPLGAPEYDAAPENGLLSRNEPIRTKVSKLTEKLRKRYPTTSTGNCSSCSTVFSVLKKRRNCSNCGNSFCSRCCSFKVFRSCMGATAPEAQRETVFVCAACNSSLIKSQ